MFTIVQLAIYVKDKRHKNSMLGCGIHACSCQVKKSIGRMHFFANNIHIDLIDFVTWGKGENNA